MAKLAPIQSKLFALVNHGPTKLETTFDMTMLTFSTGGSPRTLFVPLITGASGSLFLWLVIENQGCGH